MDEQNIICQITQLDEALVRHLKDLSDLSKENSFADQLPEGLATLRVLLEERSLKVDELNRAREQSSR